MRREWIASSGRSRYASTTARWPKARAKLGLRSIARLSALSAALLSPASCASAKPAKSSAHGSSRSGNCLPRHRDPLLYLGAGWWDPVPLPLHPSTQGNSRHRRAIGGIHVKGEPCQLDRLGHALAGSFVCLRLGAPVEVVGVKARGRFADGALGFGVAQPRLDRAGDPAGHLVLQLEYVVIPRNARPIYARQWQYRSAGRRCAPGSQFSGPSLRERSARPTRARPAARRPFCPCM